MEVSRLWHDLGLEEGLKQCNVHYMSMSVLRCLLVYLYYSVERPMLPCEVCRETAPSQQVQWGLQYGYQQFASFV